MAHALFGVEEYSKAADLFLSLCNPGTDNVHLRLALRSLGHSRRLKDARKLYGRLGADVLKNPEIRRLGIWIFEESGHLEKARDEFTGYEQLAQPDLNDRLVWLDLCLRIPDHEAAATYLRKVDVGIEGSPEARMRLAHIMDWVIDDYFKTLEIGYRALRDGYEDAKMHAGFVIGLFFMGRAGRNTDLARNVVGADTAVILGVDGRNDIVRVIESAPNPQGRFNEIAVDDPFAQRLLGKRVGDQIEIEGLMGGQTLTIKEIVSKYVHAQARSLKDCEEMFPENKFLGGLTIRDDDLLGSIQPMLDNLRQMREVGERLEEAYRKGIAPLSFLAQLGGGTVFDFWDHARNHPDLNVVVSEGSHAERQRALADLTGNDGRAIIDPATLYGLVGLGLSDTILLALPNLMITRSSVDMLQYALIERQETLGDPNNTGVMVALEEGYTMIKRTQAQVDSLIDQLSQTVDLARQLEIVMPEEGFALPAEINELFSKVGLAFADTMIVAKERDIPVLTDDLALRSVIWAEKIRCSWSQVALQEARTAGRITVDSYVDATLAFLDATYGYTSIDIEGVLHEWRAACAGPNSRLDRLIEQVASASNEKHSVARLLAGLFMEAWGKGEQESAFKCLIDQVFSALKTHQDADSAKSIMLEALSKAIDRNQRAGRRKFLPNRLRSSTYLIAPEHLTPDSDRVTKKQVEDTIGSYIRGAISD